MKQVIRGLILSAVIAACFVGASASPAHAAATTQSVAFPMYGYPGIGTLWDDIYAAGSQVPFIIANPANGPGVGSGFDYTQYTTYLNNKPASQRAIGYVYTSYHTRPIAQVITDIDDWYSLYPQVGGIFVDLVQNGGAANDVCYAATLYNYVKGKHPNDLVVMNPGSNIEAAYEPYGDIFANAENTYANYSTWTPLTDGFENNAAYASRFWHIVHTASSGQLNSALSLTRANNAGWVLVTDETMPNPYTAVPSYWSTFLTGVGSLPQTQIPNRGLTSLPNGCINLNLGTTTGISAGSQSATSTLSNTVTNTDSVRVSWGTTKLTYTTPSGATLASLGGTGWSCSTATGVCNYTGNLAANSSLPAVTATYTTGCSFTNGTATVTLKNFANNTASTSMNIAKPTACTAAASRSGAGGAAAASAAQSTPPTDETPQTTTTTQPTVSTGSNSNQGGYYPSDNQESTPTTAEPFNFVPFVIGGVVVVVLVAAGLIWWLLARRASHTAPPTYFPPAV